MAKSSSLKNELLSILIKAARWRISKPLVNFFFKYMDHFLPVDRLHENTHWVAFHHPQPNYPFHVLILPKDGLASLTEAPEDSPQLYADLFRIVKILIKENQLEKHGYRLISNGGPNQTIPQWHWHLVSDAPGVTHA